MAAAAIEIISVLSHERRRGAHLRSDLFHRTLVKHRLVRGSQGICIVDIDLVHARAVLAIVRLNFQAISVQHLTDAANHRLIDRGVVDAVAVETGVQRAKVGITLRAEAFLILAKEPYLQFRSHLRDVAACTGVLNDASQYLPRRQRERLAVLGVEIADDAGAPFFPGDGCERTDVGPHHDVAETCLPVREGQRSDYFVLDVPAEDHVALWEAFTLRRRKEVLRAHPLAAVNAIQVAAADLDSAQMILVDEVSNALDVHLACLPASSVGRIVPERLVPGAAV